MASRPERALFRKNLENSRKPLEFAKFAEFHKISRISRFSRKFRKSAARGPRPGPSLQRTDAGFGIWAALRSRAHGRSAPGPRESGPEPTGIRPRADGNPAPSRRKSGPEPTEIRPRADGNPAPTPIPSPPLKILTLLTSRSGRTLRVPPSLQYGTHQQIRALHSAHTYHTHTPPSFG